MIIEKMCRMCGKLHTIELTEEETNAYYLYAYGKKRIQDCLPQMDAYEREFLITGYCPVCQKKIFGGESYTGNRIKEVR